MAAILDADGTRQLLQPEHVIGRAPGCALRIEERYVSAQHATLRWTDAGWELKDLGSRNGTYLDGQRLTSGKEYPLRRGARIAFGMATPEWELVDDSPPAVMVVPLDAGDPVIVDGEILALPSSDDPLATLFRDTDGSWLIEYQNDATTAITDQQTFEVNGSPYRFCCPEAVCKTSIANPPLEVGQVWLNFSVSRDEEHVHLQATCALESFDLGARGHHYLLLTLARRRLEDAAAGLPETSCGWVYQEDFSHDASMRGQQLNVDVFRIRKQFAALPVVDAAKIIERRPRTRQLRIGTGRLSVVVL